MVKCLFTTGMRIQEFENYYLIYIYIYIKLTFHFLYFDILPPLQALFMVCFHLCVSPLKLVRDYVLFISLCFLFPPFLLDPNTASATHWWWWFSC